MKTIYLILSLLIIFTINAKQSAICDNNLPSMLKKPFQTNAGLSLQDIKSYGFDVNVEFDKTESMDMAINALRIKSCNENLNDKDILDKLMFFCRAQCEETYCSKMGINNSCASIKKNKMESMMQCLGGCNNFYMSFNLYANAKNNPTKTSENCSSENAVNNSVSRLNKIYEQISSEQEKSKNKSDRSK